MTLRAMSHLVELVAKTHTKLCLRVLRVSVILKAPQEAYLSQPDFTSFSLKLN